MTTSRRYTLSRGSSKELASAKRKRLQAPFSTMMSWTRRPQETLLAFSSSSME